MNKRFFFLFVFFLVFLDQGFKLWVFFNKTEILFTPGWWWEQVPFLKITYLEAKIFKSQLIGTEHLLLSILRDEDNIATQILEKFDVNYDIVKELLEYQSNNPIATTSSEPMDEDDFPQKKPSLSNPENNAFVTGFTIYLNNNQ